MSTTLPPSSAEDSEGSAETGLKALLWPRRRGVFLLGVLSILGGLTEAAFLVVVTRAAFAISDGSDEFIVTRGVTVTLLQVSLIALSLVLARLAAAAGAAWQSARLTSAVGASIRKDLARAFLMASWPVQHQSRFGYLQELLTTFAQQGASLIASVSGGMAAGFSLATLLGTAILVDPAASVIVIGAVAVLALALRPLRASIQLQAQTAAGTSTEFATQLAEVSQLGMELHIFGVQQPAKNLVFGITTQNEVAQRRLQFLRALVPALYTAMAYLAIVIALGVIGTIDSADLSAIGAVMLIMLRSLSYGQALQTASASVRAGIPFLEKLDCELNRYRTGRAQEGDLEVPQIRRLSARHVHFGYQTETPVLSDVTFDIESREVVGIVGPSGGGKSSLVQLLLGLRSPDSGSINADGIEIGRIKRSSWNRRVTFVPQDAHLINGTVAENIRFLRPGISQAEIEDAAKLAHIHDDIVTWEGSYDRQVGQQGGHLSGGQKQRIIIARALVEKPDILILDEPTSALDVQSEAAIRNTLAELQERMTIIIIAHRLSTLDICDRIMVIQDGEIKAFDTPGTLASQSEFYAEALRLSGLA